MIKLTVNYLGELLTRDFTDKYWAMRLAGRKSDLSAEVCFVEEGGATHTAIITRPGTRLPGLIDLMAQPRAYIPARSGPPGVSAADHASIIAHAEDRDKHEAYDNNVVEGGE